MSVMPRALRALLLVGLALTAGACAAREGVPRPFPGAALPPGARDPRAPEPRPVTPAPPVAATPAAAPASADPQPPPAVTGEAAGPLDLVVRALGFRGVPYRFGGSDPAGFDCSGFIQYVFRQVGALLPREVVDQWRLGSKVDRDEVQPGDLVFFETVTRGASHVGLAIGNGEFVHAPSSNGVVRVERLATRYWAERWVGARRVSVSRRAE